MAVPFAPTARDTVAPLAGADAAAVEAHLRRAARAPSAPWLHGEVAERMQRRLDIVRVVPEVVIDWWSWLGASRDTLLRRYPRAGLLVVEPTDALRRRSADALHVPRWKPSAWRTPRHGASTETDAPRDARAQLLWSNMMLHWCADPHTTLVRWNEALAPGGFVMFSCFGPDTLKQLRPLYRAMGWGPPAHGFVDMHDLGDALLHAGFAEPVMDMEQLQLTWADARHALAELRGLGGNAAAGRFAGLRSRCWGSRLGQALTRHLAGADGRLSLSFEIVYGHAFKMAPRPPRATETRIDVASLRRTARPVAGRGAAD